jgi:hypothetical protein
MPDQATSDRQWIATLMGRCQVLAGRLGETSAAALIPDMRALVAELPSSTNRNEQLVVSGVLGQLLARIVRSAGIDGRADVAHEFLELAAARMGLIRFGGHLPKGGYDVHDGRHDTGQAGAPAL